MHFPLYFETLPFSVNEPLGSKALPCKNAAAAQLGKYRLLGVLRGLERVPGEGGDEHKSSFSSGKESDQHHTLSAIRRQLTGEEQRGG